MNYNCVGIEVQKPSLTILLSTDDLFYFEDKDRWTSLEYGLDAAMSDIIILLDDYNLPTNNYAALVGGIIQGTVSIVSDGSFNLDSSIGPASMSNVILAPLVECDTKLYANGNNWVTSSKWDQSAYRSKLVGVIVALTILDVLVRHHNIPEVLVTITLDG